MTSSSSNSDNNNNNNNNNDYHQDNRDNNTHHHHHHHHDDHPFCPIPANHAPLLHGIATLSAGTAILPLRTPCITLASPSEEDSSNAAIFIQYETQFLTACHDALSEAAHTHLSSGDEVEQEKSEEWESFFYGVNTMMTAHRREMESMWNLCDEYVATMLEKLDINPSARNQGANSQKVMELSRKYGSSINNNKTGGEKSSKSSKRKRSLGKQATEVLNTWFFSHLHDPYPTDEEKQMLAKKCGLTLTQINNWFGNKRMRYKRKMLEHARRGDVPPDGSPAPSAAGTTPITPGSSPGSNMFDSPQQPNTFQWHTGSNYP